MARRAPRTASARATSAMGPEPRRRARRNRSASSSGPPPLVPAAVLPDHVGVEPRVVQPYPERDQVERPQQEADREADQSAGARIAAGVLVHRRGAERTDERPDEVPRREVHDVEPNTGLVAVVVG